jgi:hypothetical protein
MARFILSNLALKRILIVATCVAASLYIRAPIALAQHGGGHVGGGGHFGGAAHAGGGSHVSAPHISASTVTHVPAPRFRFSGPPPLGAGTANFGVGAAGFHFRPRPIRPPRGLPIFPFPVLFGSAFYGYGFWPGFGFNSLWWPSCSPLWGWGYGCGPSPFYGYGLYGYGFGTYGYPYVPPPSYEPPTYYEPPQPYPYGGGSGRELPQLLLKDGSVYNVTDYWLVEGQIHFMTVEDGGNKSVQRVIPFDDLDLQRTIDVNTRLGFKFVLRNEPVEQYLQHHPDANPPATPPPQ